MRIFWKFSFKKLNLYLAITLLWHHNLFLNHIYNNIIIFINYIDKSIYINVGIYKKEKLNYQNTLGIPSISLILLSISASLNTDNISFSSYINLIYVNIIKIKNINLIYENF